MCMDKYRRYIFFVFCLNEHDAGIRTARRRLPAEMVQRYPTRDRHPLLVP